MTTDAIRAEGLSKWFGEGETRNYAVREVSLSASFGEMLYIVGPSGSGKTTLLSMISGILRPNSENVWVGDVDVWRLDDNHIASVAVGFTIASNIYTTIAYLVHERLWTKVAWGWSRPPGDIPVGS